MTKKHSTKKALIASLLMLCLCFTSLIGTTYAWFTDSVASGSNVITAGNLDIEVDYSLDGDNWSKLDGANDIFEKGLWEPGHTEVVALRIKNTGTLALKYTATMNVVEEIIGKNAKDEDIVLSDILEVTTITHEANMIGDILVNLIFGGSKNTDTSNNKPFKSANVLDENQELLPGASHYVCVTVAMPETVGNEANAKAPEFTPSIEFGINVLATQYTHEEDSFGNQYDKDADASVFVSTPAELKEAILAGEDVVLTEDVTLTEKTTFDVPAKIDLGGNTLSTVGLAFNAGGEVTNGSFESADKTNMVPHFSVANGNLVMDNVTIEVDDYLVYQAQGNRAYAEFTGFDATNASVIMNDCHIVVKNTTYRTWNYTYGITANNSTVVMNGGSITVESAGAQIQDLATAISCMGDATVTLNNVEVNAKTLGTTMGHLIVNTTDKTVTDADFVSFGGTYEYNFVD